MHNFLGNLEPRNIPPNRSCCNTAHPFGSNDLDSPPKRRFSTRTHTHIFRFPRIHKWRHTQRKQQRRPQPTACETTVRNAVGLTTRCHLTNHDRGEQLTPSCHHDQKVERHCPSQGRLTPSCRNGNTEMAMTVRNCRAVAGNRDQFVGQLKNSTNQANSENLSARTVQFPCEQMWDAVANTHPRIPLNKFD